MRVSKMPLSFKMFSGLSLVTISNCLYDVVRCYSTVIYMYEPRVQNIIYHTSTTRKFMPFFDLHIHLTLHLYRTVYSYNVVLHVVCECVPLSKVLNDQLLLRSVNNLQLLNDQIRLPSLDLVTVSVSGIRNVRDITRRSVLAVVCSSLILSSSLIYSIRRK